MELFSLQSIRRSLNGKSDPLSGSISPSRVAISLRLSRKLVEPESIINEDPKFLSSLGVSHAIRSKKTRREKPESQSLGVIESGIAYTA